jgi:hypothetical protein
MNDVIRLERVRRGKNRLTFHFDSRLPFFRKKSFFVEYDRDVSRAPAGVQAVPFAAAMTPVAWAAGARVAMGPLDRSYLSSLNRCGDYFRSRVGRRWSFESCVEAVPVEHPDPASGAGMLFSSGLDSLATYARHEAERPELFTIFGADIPLAHVSFIEMCKKRLDAFARERGTAVRYVHTDVRETIDEERLRRYSQNWYGEVSHGLLMTGLVAPAAFGSVRTLYVAGCSHRAVNACGSDADLLDRVRWAGAGVKSDGHGLSRVEKIARFLKDREDLHASLRVCWMQFESLNCGRCEKCLRTICELLANNVDPGRCNFTVDGRTLPALRQSIEKGYYLFFNNESTLDFWRALQQEVDLDGLRDIHGSRAFFEWLESFRPLRLKPNPLLRAGSSAYLQLRDALHAFRQPVPGPAAQRAQA